VKRRGIVTLVAVTVHGSSLEDGARCTVAAAVRDAIPSAVLGGDANARDTMPSTVLAGKVGPRQAMSSTVLVAKADVS
jgi:hypothetical protein